jgi:hypothetical protein
MGMKRQRNWAHRQPIETGHMTPSEVLQRFGAELIASTAPNAFQRVWRGCCSPFNAAWRSGSWN